MKYKTGKYSGSGVRHLLKGVCLSGNMCGTHHAREVSSPVETWLGDLAGGARVWCSEVAGFASQAQVAASTLLTTVTFAQPRLLRLPHSYDAIFQVR